MRSTRFMGKNSVGKPMRSPSGSLIWRMKWSKELRSIPRMVIPAWWMTSSSPQIFSLGVCRLTTTMECGSMDDESQLTSGIQVVEAQPRLCLSSIILSPLNGNVKMSPYEQGDICIEPERATTSGGDFQMREGGVGVCQGRRTPVSER